MSRLNYNSSSNRNMDSNKLSFLIMFVPIKLHFQVIYIEKLPNQNIILMHIKICGYSNNMFSSYTRNYTCLVDKAPL